MIERPFQRAFITIAKTLKIAIEAVVQFPIPAIRFRRVSAFAFSIELHFRLQQIMH